MSEERSQQPDRVRTTAPPTRPAGKTIPTGLIVRLPLAVCVLGIVLWLGKTQWHRISAKHYAAEEAFYSDNYALNVAASHYIYDLEWAEGNPAEGLDQGILAERFYALWQRVSGLLMVGQSHGKTLNVMYRTASRGGWLDESGIAAWALSQHLAGASERASEIAATLPDDSQYADPLQSVFAGEQPRLDPNEWFSDLLWCDRWLQQKAYPNGTYPKDWQVDGDIARQQFARSGVRFYLPVLLGLLVLIPGLLLLRRGPGLRSRGQAGAAEAAMVGDTLTSRWDPLQTIGVFAISGVVGFVLIELLYRYFFFANDPAGIRQMLVWTFEVGLPVMGLLLIFFPSVRAACRVFGVAPLPPGFGLARMLLACLVGFGFCFLAAWLLSLGEIFLGVFDARDGLSRSGAFVLPWSDYLSAVVLAPLIEEFIFRGVLLRAFHRRWGMVVALLLSSLLFTIPHGYSLGGQIHIFCFGLIMGILYLRTRCLWVPMLVHAAYNLVVTYSYWELYGDKF